VAGLIIKPIAGVLDAASKTAEGLTNTATHFDEKPNSDRIRLVRPFYGK
jgi:vacuolar protein sorting-associated protein 13A/C